MMLLFAIGPLPAAHAATTLVQQGNNGYNFGTGSWGSIQAAVYLDVTKGDVLVVGAETPAVCGGVSVVDTVGFSYSLQAAMGGPSFDAGIYTATVSSSGTDGIWLVCGGVSGSNLVLNIYVYELAGVTLASAMTGTGSGTGTAVSTSSVSYAAGSFLVGVVADNFGGSATAGHGFTLSAEASGTGVSGAEFETAGAAGSSSFPATLASSVQWAEAAIALSPTVPVALVCPSSSGGALMPAGATFTSSGNTWMAPSGNDGMGGYWNSYFFVGPMTSIPPPMLMGWGGAYGTYGGQMGWVVTFYC
jgi:hypothetical protein